MRLVSALLMRKAEFEVEKKMKEQSFDIRFLGEYYEDYVRG